MINLSLKKSCGVSSLRPFNYITYSVGTRSNTILVLLAAQCLMLFLTGSFSSLIIVALALAASICAECVYYFVPFFEAQNEHYWRIISIQGILVGLLIPANYPPLAVFFVTFSVMLLCKYVFGRFSSAWANVISLVIIVLYFINSKMFPSFLLTAQDLQSKNAALVLIQNGTIPIAKADASVTSFLNKTVFHFLGISIPEGYISFLWDSGFIIPAFRFNLLTLISSIILFSHDMIDYIIPLIFVFVYSILVKFLLPVFLGGIMMQGDIILALLSSGTLFCTLYLLQWFGTIPMTGYGKCVYGILAGIVAFLLIGFGTSSIGYVFTVLVMNVFSPMIQLFEDKVINRRAKRVLVKSVKILNGEDENV